MDEALQLPAAVMDEHYTFYATTVEAESGTVIADNGVVAIHSLTFTNPMGQVVQIAYPPEMARHVANAAQACIMADVRESIARTAKRRSRLLKRDK